MYNERLDKIFDELSKMGLEQMVISDPCSIYYLTGKMIKPGERMLALYINKNGGNKLFINNLFTVNEELGVEKVRFTDDDNPASLLAQATNHTKPLGIDKTFASGFLITLMENNAAAKYMNSSICVDKVRACKDSKERELMREASRVNDYAMGEIIKRVTPNMTEIQLADHLKDIYASKGAYEYSFDPLIGFGECAAIGHYEAGNTVLKEGQCVLIDMGCVKNGYCSDMTRTFFYKSVSDEHRKLYEIVKKAQQAAIDVIKPGVRFCDIDKAARDIITEAGYGKQFNHRLGHSIGIECHEFGDVSQANNNKVKEGMIFSIEPGIYLEGNVGIRIEDLVMVTKDGVEVLNSFPKDLMIIE